MPVPDGFMNTILDREVEIMKRVTGIVDAGKHAFFIPTRFPYAVVFVGAGGVTTVNTHGYDSLEYQVAVTLRVLGGPVGGGYAGQMEDKLNDLYFAVFNAFAKNPDMANPVVQYPSDTDKMMYLAAGDYSALVTRNGGTVVFSYGLPTAPTFFFGTEFTHLVKVQSTRR